MFIFIGRLTIQWHVFAVFLKCLTCREFVCMCVLRGCDGSYWGFSRGFSWFWQAAMEVLWFSKMFSWFQWWFDSLIGYSGGYLGFQECSQGFSDGLTVWQAVLEVMNVFKSVFRVPVIIWQFDRWQRKSLGLSKFWQLYHQKKENIIENRTSQSL